ncbi:MAG: hypothetical protein HQL53_13780 [Magnetococcales bacterium]|nr:hypothetical protein [Magnetococcales bacterium]
MMVKGHYSAAYIGKNLRIDRISSLIVSARRHQPLSQAVLSLADPAGEVFRAVSVSDRVRIHFGERDGDAATWYGSVTTVQQAGPDQIEIGCVGEEQPLSTYLITQTWRNETPESILADTIRQAGLAVGRIDKTGMILPHFVAANQCPWEISESLAGTCQRQLGLDMSRWALWMSSTGHVNWGDFEEQKPTLPVIATGAGLIRHQPAEGNLSESRIETFLLPNLWHSQPVRLKDQRRGLNELRRVLAVEHRIDQGSARTFINTGVENARI